MINTFKLSFDYMNMLMKRICFSNKLIKINLDDKHI